MDIYPWNEAVWKLLTHQPDSVPAGLMLCGIEGLGKNALAVCFARFLLCGREGERRAANVARQFDAGSHPDFHVVAPEAVTTGDTAPHAQYARRYLTETPSTDRKAKSVIGVDQIRTLIDRLSRASHFGGAKVALLTPAESMNINAANALLKLLEEPPAGTTLILVAQDPTGIPLTVCSRCMRVEFKPPQLDVARSWLQSHYPELADPEILLGLTGNAPLAAVRLGKQAFLERRESMLTDLTAIIDGYGDPVGSAARWGQIGASEALKWLQGALLDLLRCRQSTVPPVLFNPDRIQHFQVLANRIHLRKVFKLLASVGEARRQIGGTLDEALLLEGVLVRLRESTTTRE